MRSGLFWELPKRVKNANAVGSGSTATAAEGECGLLVGRHPLSGEKLPTSLKKNRAIQSKG